MQNNKYKNCICCELINDAKNPGQFMLGGYKYVDGGADNVKSGPDYCINVDIHQCICNVI